MCEEKNRIIKEDVWAKLSNNPKIAIPRNVKLLQQCVDDFWQCDNSEINPVELFNFCQNTAGLNGKNAFLRAFKASTDALKEQENIRRLRQFVDENKNQDFVEVLLKNGELTVLKKLG